MTAPSLGSLLGAVVAIIDCLEDSGFAYALGGAIAYGSWAEPRATRDIDVNVWAGPEALDRAFDVLEAAGVTLDRPQAELEASERGMFVGHHGEYRVDVFVPSVPFYAEALARRSRVRLAGRDTWVLSAEVLAVFKMLFFRPKDLVDVGRLLEVQGARFDHDFVRRWLAEMLGEADQRVTSWDELVTARSGR